METRQLRYFLAVAKWGGFSHAADHIGIAQPALSAQIAKLEKQLGCLLFVRKARGVELTPAGARLRVHALEILDRLELAFEDTKLLAEKNGPEFSLGIPTLMSPLLVAPLIEAAQQHLPGLTLRLREGMGAALRDMLAAGEVDAAILYKVPGEGFAEALLLLEEPLFVGALASVAKWEGRTCSAQQLSRLPLILSSPGNSHRKLLEYFASKAGLSLNIVSEVDSVQGHIELILKGVGAGVLPLSGYDRWPKRRDLRLARIGGDGLVSQAYLVRSHETKDQQSRNQMDGLVRRVVNELIRAGTWRGALSARSAGRRVRDIHPCSLDSP